MYYLVEEKIKKSIEDGDFDHLPGMGKPLDLKDELPGLSPEIKMVYKTLKNAGFIPENSNKNQNSITFQELVNTATDGMYEEMVKGEFKKRIEFGEFVKKRKLHVNPGFSTYAKKIYNKLFNK